MSLFHCLLTATLALPCNTPDFQRSYRGWLAAGRLGCVQGRVRGKHQGGQVPGKMPQAQRAAVVLRGRQFEGTARITGKKRVNKTEGVGWNESRWGLGCADVESGWEQRGWTEGYGRRQSNCGKQGGLRLAGPISKNLQLRMGGSSGGEQRLLWTGARCAGYRECGLGLVRCTGECSRGSQGCPAARECRVQERRPVVGQLPALGWSLGGCRWGASGTASFASPERGQVRLRLGHALLAGQLTLGQLLAARQAAHTRRSSAAGGGGGTQRDTNQLCVERCKRLCGSPLRLDGLGKQAVQVLRQLHERVLQQAGREEQSGLQAAGRRGRRPRPQHQAPCRLAH